MSKKRKSRRRQRNKPTQANRRRTDLDVVIPVYGQPELLSKCLASIEATRHSPEPCTDRSGHVRSTGGEVDLRVYLVDDASPDAEVMKPVYGSLNGHTRLLRNKENLGFPRTVNRGVMQGQSPLILILNSDVELGKGCLQAMIAEFDNEQVGVVGPKLLFPEVSPDPKTRPAGKIQHAGLAVNFRGQVIHANIVWSADHPKVNQRRVMQAVTGACLMTRRSLWNTVTRMYRQAGMPTDGAFNEVYGRGTYEDVEYCLAVRGNGGHQTIYQPEAVATHWTGASAVASGQAFPIQRNEMIFRARCGHVLAWDQWRFT